MRSIFLFSFYTITLSAFANKGNRGNIDSVLNVLSEKNHDTVYYNCYINLGNYYININIDSTFFYHEKAQEKASELYTKDRTRENKIREAEVLKFLGWDLFLKSDYPNAIKTYESAILIVNPHLNDTNAVIKNWAQKIQSACIGNMGGAYYSQGNYPLAINCHFKALQINERIKNKKSMATNYGNIALVYQSQKEYEKAIEYANKAVKIDTELGNKNGVSRHLGNIGIIYNETKEYDKAIDYFSRSLAISKEIENHKMIATNYANMGNSYYYKLSKFATKGSPDWTLLYKTTWDYYCSAQSIFESIKDKRGICSISNKKGAMCIEQNDYKNAKKYIQQSLELAIEIGSLQELKYAYLYYYELSKKINNPTQALDYYRKYVEIKDSLINQDNLKATLEKEFIFNYEKQHIADSISNSKQKEILNAQIEKQQTEIKLKKNQQIALFGGLSMVILFAGFMYNRFNAIRKQKLIIEEQKQIVEHQKNLVEEKQKEIIDSINYAKRIQQSILPSEKYISNKLKKNS
ncbi:MAG: tetratricopeptide repeat protein [Bacteroidia bacterium]|nr:tetratricopeptide repeat protein [Bacteroidia bacterium]